MSDFTYDSVTLALDGQLAILCLNNPDRLNAINPEMAEDIMRALQEASKPKHAVRALYVKGAGRAFCAGANLSGRKLEKLPALLPVEAVYHPLVRKFRDFERPIVVGVHGACVGLGLAITLQSDYVVASSDAYFATPFAKLGSGVDGGLTWTLPRVIGTLRARRMLMMLERVSATDAHAWGLVSQILPAENFAEVALGIARGLADGPTVALSEMRRLLMDAQRADFDAHLEAEARALARTFRSRDNVAGMKAYAARTDAVFSGN